MEQTSKLKDRILISVDTELNLERSFVDQGRFFYNYRIRIHNNTSCSVRLLSRHWEIYDSLHPTRYIDGEGVVGLTPDLSPNEHFSYTSGCDLYSEIGSMSGYYVFERSDTKEVFQVEIPPFELIFFGKMN